MIQFPGNAIKFPAHAKQLRRMIVKAIPAVPIESSHCVHCAWLMQITNWVEMVVKGILGRSAGEIVRLLSKLSDCVARLI